MTRIVLKPGYEREIKREARPKVRRAARRVAAIGKSIAPVDKGHYRDSIEDVEIAGRVFVRTTDFVGHIIEWGDAMHPPRAVIRRAARAAGLRVEETDK